MSIGRQDDAQASRDATAAATFPCTLLQERFWAVARSERPYGLNVAMRWLVEGRLSHEATEGALRALVQRHEILRTSFREDSGRLAQVIHPSCQIKLRNVDLSALASEEERLARAEEIARIEALELMDLTQAPLLRASLLRLGADRSMLLLTFHGMIADGWSIGLLVAEFRAAASAIEAGAMPDASAPDLQFADYALWERELLASSDLDESRAYWRRQLQGAVGTVVPPDHEPVDRRGDHGEITSILMPPTLSAAIDAYAHRHGVTLFGLAAAALALMLRRLTGRTEIVFGSQVANRQEAAAEALAGPTVNSITLRLLVDDGADLAALAGKAAEVAQEALQHQRLPFEIASTLVPRPAGARLQAVNLVVHRSYSGTSETEGADGAFTLVSVPSFSSGTQWDLNFYVIGRDEGWRMSCEADATLFDASTVRDFLEMWRSCLEAIVTTPDRRWTECPAVRGIPQRAIAAADQPTADQPLIVFQEPSRQIVRFHDHGSRTPMIVMNNQSVYYLLARELGADRPFIDIQAYHPDGPLDLSWCTFDDFATYAVRLIRWAQPSGPYVVGGHCVYGALAFEAARQLQAMGERVLLVALFDTWAPGYRETMSERDKQRRHRRLQFEARRKRIVQYRKGEIGLKELLWKPILRRLGHDAPGGPPPDAEPFAGYWFDNYIYEAAARHRPKPAALQTVLFRSQETLRGRLFDELMGWQPLVTGRLQKVEIASAHLDMFREKPAAQIAAALNPLLAQAESRQDG